MSFLANPAVREPLAAVKRRVYHTVARAVAVGLRVLPRPIGAEAKERAEAVGLLDFPEPIRMTANTPTELRRLHACRKEPETLAWLQREMGPGDVLYDVGANVGAYSLVADRCARGQGRVYAFEPSATTFALLTRNVFLNGAEERVTPLFVALADSNALGHMELRSLAAGDASHGMADPAARPNGSTGAFRQPVSFARLDDLVATYGLAQPTLMKIDVDGGELGVLRGGPRVLRAPSLRGVLIEIDSADANADATLACLAAHGFAVAERHAHGPGGTGVVNYILRRAAAA